MSTKQNFNTFICYNNTGTDKYIGEILTYSGSNPDVSVWLACDGKEYKISTYPNLYNIIGNIYNTTGNGTTNFNVPDTNNRFISGLPRAIN